MKKRIVLSVNNTHSVVKSKLSSLSIGDIVFFKRYDALPFCVFSSFVCHEANGKPFTVYELVPTKLDNGCAYEDDNRETFFMKDREVYLLESSFVDLPF